DRGLDLRDEVVAVLGDAPIPPSVPPGPAVEEGKVGKAKPDLGDLVHGKVTHRDADDGEQHDRDAEVEKGGVTLREGFHASRLCGPISTPTKRAIPSDMRSSTAGKAS